MKRITRVPFEYGGKILNLLFGIIDAETVRGYATVIDKLETKMQENSNISKKQLLHMKKILK